MNLEENFDERKILVLGRISEIVNENIENIENDAVCSFFKSRTAVFLDKKFSNGIVIPFHANEFNGLYDYINYVDTNYSFLIKSNAVEADFFVTLDSIISISAYFIGRNDFIVLTAAELFTEIYGIWICDRCPKIATLKKTIFYYMFDYAEIFLRGFIDDCKNTGKTFYEIYKMKNNEKCNKKTRDMLLAIPFLYAIDSRLLDRYENELKKLFMSDENQKIIECILSDIEEIVLSVIDGINFELNNMDDKSLYDMCEDTKFENKNGFEKFIWSVLAADEEKINIIKSIIKKLRRWDENADS